MSDETKVFPYVYNWDRQSRKGQFCRVITRGKSFNSAAVEFEDGFTMVTSRNSLRRRKEFVNSVALTKTGAARKTARKYPSLSNEEARSHAAISQEQRTAAKGHEHAI